MKDPLYLLQLCLLIKRLSYRVMVVFIFVLFGIHVFVSGIAVWPKTNFSHG